MSVKIKSDNSSDELRVDPTSKAGRVTLYDTAGSVINLALDHLTAGLPSSVRLSDGSAFYDAAKTGQLPAALVGGRLDTNVGSWLGSTTPTVGQKIMAASLPVTLASDQSALAVTGTFFQATQPVSGTVAISGSVAVTGPLTDTQLRATPVPVSGTVTANIGTAGSLALDATLTARFGTLGQKAMAGSAPVVIASDQSALPVTGTFFQATQPVSGTITANIGTSGSLALDATLAKLTITQGTALGSNTLAMVGGAVLTGAPSYTTGQISPLSLTTTGDLRIAAAALPLPSGAATQTTLATLLLDATFTGRINTLGQKAMAASTPVVLASDQSSIPVTGTFFQATQPVSIAATVAVSSTQLPAALVGGRLDDNIGSWLGSTVPTVGSKTSANSIPVVIASDQGAVPVSGTVTANIGTSGSLALDATLTGGTARTKITDGTNNAAVKAASTAAGATDPALVVAISPNNTVGVTGTFFQATQPVSIAATVPISTAATASTTTVLAAQAATATLTNLTSSASNQTALAAQAARKGAMFFNDSTAACFLKFGATASATSYTVKMTAASLFELPTPAYTGQIDVIWASANGALRITELT